MLNEIKDLISRSPASLAQDFAGGAALVALLFAGLYLPGLA